MTDNFTRVTTGLFVFLICGLVMIGQPRHAMADEEMGEQQMQKIITERQAILKSIGKNFKELFIFAKMSDVPYDKMQDHVTNMKGSAEKLLDLFPAGSDVDNAHFIKTEALSDIWQKNDEFKKLQQNFIASLGGLGEKIAAQESGDELATSFRNLGKENCKVCHDGFRAPH